MSMITHNYGEATVMYRNGSVYSPADPFATAVLVQGDRVVWVGEEAGADSLTDDKVTTVDLDGLVLVPGFVGRAGSTPGENDRSAMIAAGYTACIVDDTQRPMELHSFSDEPDRQLPAEVVVRRESESAGSPGESEMLIEASLSDTDWIDLVRDELRNGSAVGLLPGVRTRGTESPVNPWAWAALGLRSDVDAVGLPTRATFTAQTRGVKRLFRAGGPFGGQIVPDSSADFTGWRAEALMVQTADTRIAAWSTDPRARTPLLPELVGEKYPVFELARIGTTEYRM